MQQPDKYIPILFISAKDDLSSKQKGFQLGIDDYMAKLVDLAELKICIRALLWQANISKGSWHSQRRGSNAPLYDRSKSFAKVIFALQGASSLHPQVRFGVQPPKAALGTEKERNAPGYRCIIAPFILKGLERSGLLANRESS